MKHYGDITTINGAKVEPVDVITGGSPCQDLSVAGKRAGLAGERSGLFMEQIRIIKEMRKHELELHSGRTDEPLRPRYMVWENVYGAFSSNGGEDFRAVLEETAKVAQGDAVIPQLADGQKWPSSGYIMGDRWSIAWRGHDAQWWGVPQRRKRVCMVADFNWHSAPYILFDPQLRGEAEYTATFETVGDIGSKHRPEVQPLSESMSGNIESRIAEREGIAGAIKKCVNDASELIAFTNRGYDKTSGKSSDALRADCHGANPMICIDSARVGLGSAWDGTQVSPTLTENNAGGEQRMPDKGNFNAVISYGLDRASFNQGKNAKFDFSIEAEKIAAQVARGPGAIGTSQLVRRLTPLECERLQGYPDGWTDIGEWTDSQGKKHKDADSPRYKALGNSIALPFWAWMAKRMAEYLPEGATMASLFDGIGGFPLVYQACGVRPVWASEIEEFPIAVTKIRFPEPTEGE